MFLGFWFWSLSQQESGLKPNVLSKLLFKEAKMKKRRNKDSFLDLVLLITGISLAVIGSMIGYLLAISDKFCFWFQDRCKKYFNLPKRQAN
jgi:hypothetical protein